MNIRDIAKMNYGPLRRKMLLIYIRTSGYGLAINRKYCLPDSDPDLQYLLKHNKVKRYRDNGGTHSGGRNPYGTKRYCKRTTFLVINDE